VKTDPSDKRKPKSDDMLKTLDMSTDASTPSNIGFNAPCFGKRMKSIPEQILDLADIGRTKSI